MNINDIIQVVVTKVEPGYVKVDYNGHEETLQITELTWRYGRVNPEDYVRVGQSIRVKVIAVLGDRFSVSMREAALGGNPWENPPKKGEVYFSPVVFVADYGYFFELAYYCQALMKIENVKGDYQIGDRVKVVVSKVDLERNRVEVLPE